MNTNLKIFALEDTLNSVGSRLPEDKELPEPNVVLWATALFCFS